MISFKRLLAMARKWQRMAGIKRRSISLPRMSHNKVAVRGHFVVYASDEARFLIPLGYLRTIIFRELLRMSEEQFGLPTDGPITLPCDKAFMEYVLSLARERVPLELENAAQQLVASSFGFGSDSQCLAPLSVSQGLASCPVTIGGGS